MEGKKPQLSRNGYHGGYVPASLVAALIDGWLERNVEDENPVGALIILLFPEQTIGLAPWDAARKLGRTIDKLREQQWIGFDRADKIVTRLGGWRQSDELWEAYTKVSLTALDINHPTCSQVQRENATWLRERLKVLGTRAALCAELGIRHQKLNAAMGRKPVTA